MPARDPFFKKNVEFQMTGREKKNGFGETLNFRFSADSAKTGGLPTGFSPENQGTKNHVKGSTNT